MGETGYKDALITMRHIIISLFVICQIESTISHAQDMKNVTIKLFKKHKSIDNFELYLVDKDSVLLLNTHSISSDALNSHSLRICYQNHHLLIPSRADSIEYVQVYLDRKSFKEMTGERIKGGKIFRKKYYIDLGLDIIMTITRSNRKF